VSGRVRDAVANLLATLAEESVEWVVTEPVEILLPPDVPRLVVGRTTYSAKLPRLAIGPEFALKQRFVEPVATARVVSRGWNTARVLARQAFAESAAILDLVAPPANTGSEATLARRRSDRPGAPAFTRTNWWFKAGTFSGSRLAPPYLHLSRAAARDEKSRSDWQRRVLGAVRWYSRGHRSESPADRVVSAMVALESLFIVGRQEHRKGALIADRVTDRFRTRHMTEAAQRDWLRRLYQIRNDAAHEGREVLDDLEVDSLLDLTLVVVRYGAFTSTPTIGTQGERAGRTRRRCAATSRSRRARFMRESPLSPPVAASGQCPGERLNEAIPSSRGDAWRTPDARVKRVLSR